MVDMLRNLAVHRCKPFLPQASFLSSEVDLFIHLEKGRKRFIPPLEFHTQTRLNRLNSALEILRGRVKAIIAGTR